MQPVGGGAPRPGLGHPLPRSLLQLDPVALLMLLVDADPPEPVRSGARELALFLTPEPGAEVVDRGWRWGRRVSGLRVWALAPRGRKGWVRPPERRDPNPWCPRRILSQPAQGPEGPLLCGEVMPGAAQRYAAGRTAPSSSG